jgi:hypothetical protein
MVSFFVLSPQALTFSAAVLFEHLALRLGREWTVPLAGENRSSLPALVGETFAVRQLNPAFPSRRAVGETRISSSSELNGSARKCRCRPKPGTRLRRSRLKWETNNVLFVLLDRSICSANLTPLSSPGSSKTAQTMRSMILVGVG